MHESKGRDRRLLNARTLQDTIRLNTPKKKTRLIFTCRNPTADGTAQRPHCTLHEAHLHQSQPSLRQVDHATLECRDIRQVTTSTRTRTAEQRAQLLRAASWIRASASPPCLDPRPHAHRPGPAAGRRLPRAGRRRVTYFLLACGNRRATLTSSVFHVFT